MHVFLMTQHIYSHKILIRNDITVVKHATSAFLMLYQKAFRNLLVSFLSTIYLPP